MGRQFPRTAAALTVLLAGLLTGWNAPLSVAQQSPDAWSGEHRAVLPSGLSVQLEFAATPGTEVAAAAGELADRPGGGRAAGPYADGMHPGNPAQTFSVTENRPQADGSWRTVGTLRLAFSRPVRNPRLHLSGLVALATGKSGTTSTAARLTLTGGSPAAPTLVNRTDWPGWTVDANALAPVGADGSSDGAAGSVSEGTLELVGTLRTAVFRVEQRSTARAGSTTAPPVLRQAYTVTVDEDLGTAPQNYGNASHVLSDLFLGAAAANAAHRTRPRSADDRDAADRPTDEPLVQLDHGAGRRSAFASPPPPKLQPGRGEYQGADPSISFPTEAAIGRYYRLTVPVAVGDQPATLAGWIDFDHSGRFDPADRVQTEIPAGADTATLEWTVPTGAGSGDTWARLRIARDASQLVPSGGFADSGQVTDQRIKLTVGAARPEIAEPVDGAVLAEARPRIHGDGAVAGASVEIRDGDATACRARVERRGDWSCRPGEALAAGPHSLTPVEITSGGVVLRGEAVRVTVKTAPPAAPVLTLPEYTNDPGIQLTGTGEAGSIVAVTDQAAELCRSAVRADGQWSCLPVENLLDGRHLLTPVAVDAAGNRTAGQAVALVVDTVPPDKPVLGSPAAGETLRVSRPTFTGRAEPGSKVLVTARAGGSAASGSASAAGERTVLCGATAALDGSWTCTANRDLTDGQQWLVVTATDLAGNGAAADAVPVRVAAAASPSASAPASASASASAVPSSGASAPARPSPAASVPTVASPSASASVAASASAVPSSGASVPVRPSPAASVPTVPTVPTVPSPSASASVPIGPSPSVAVPVLPSAGASAPVASSVPSRPAMSPTSPAPSPSPSRPSIPVTSSPSPAVGAAPDAPVLAPVPVGVLPIAVPAAAGPSAASVTPTAPTAPTVLPTAPTTTSSVPPTLRTVPPLDASPFRAAVGVVASSPSPSPSLPPPPASPPSPSSTPVVAEPLGSAGESAGQLPAPPSTPPVGAAAEASQAAAARSTVSGWRGGVAGGLLVLAAIGLITRRVFARGDGGRRR
ncbi:Ig-like domain-containing protein [Kitasatospora sp. NPDC057940]|uniref:Ig-like domain-containing protein n=1 Tax=Kitasatospora sp. NPDC057940 TaxID=3346285 RepID=UPI0036DAB31E